MSRATALAQGLPNYSRSPQHPKSHRSRSDHALILFTPSGTERGNGLTFSCFGFKKFCLEFVAFAAPVSKVHQRAGGKLFAAVRIVMVAG
jgi:hypothetical protein